MTKSSRRLATLNRIVTKAEILMFMLQIAAAAMLATILWMGPAHHARHASDHTKAPRQVVAAVPPAGIVLASNAPEAVTQINYAIPATALAPLKGSKWDYSLDVPTEVQKTSLDGLKAKRHVTAASIPAHKPSIQSLN